MSFLFRRACQSIGNSIRQRSGAIRKVTEDATLKRDDYMQNVKFPGLWVYLIWGYVMARVIHHGYKMENIIQEQIIFETPLAERTREPDHELLSSYHHVPSWFT